MFFFFSSRRRHTRLTCDWSSDVCSSDLAGGNLVTATMTGTGELTALTIAPAAVDLDDLETLQDLVVAAVRDAKRAADELAAQSMGPLAGGLGGGLGLPGF